jgi:hypothetical protein
LDRLSNKGADIPTLRNLSHLSEPPKWLSNTTSKPSSPADIKTLKNYMKLKADYTRFWQMVPAHVDKEMLDKLPRKGKAPSQRSRQPQSVKPALSIAL